MLTGDSNYAEAMERLRQMREAAALRTKPPPPATTPPPPVPSPADQSAWHARVLPICQTCPAFGGTVETPAARITVKVRCAGCKTCGGKTISAVQRCPAGKW